MLKSNKRRKRTISTKGRMAALRRQKINKAARSNELGISIFSNKGHGSVADTNDCDARVLIASTSHSSANKYIAVNERSIVENASSSMDVCADEEDVLYNDASTLQSVSATLPATIVEACIENASSEMQNDMDEEIENIVLHEDGNIDVDRLHSEVLSGRSIVNMAHIFKELQRLSQHNGTICGFTELVLMKMIRHGLRTQYFVKCRMCNYTNSFWNDPTDDKILDVNTGAACGAVLAGIGHKQLEEVLAAMDVQCMSSKTYIEYEKVASKGFATAANNAMRAAGEMEKQLAIKRGDVIDGSPHIPVMADGSWMKRSYRTGGYNSPSGAAIIIGYHTRKVLFVGVRNKYCVVCARAANKNETPKNHECYKNWATDQSSTSMESDIILEGFRESKAKHGLIYSSYIGDGDSNVLQTLSDFSPYDELAVKKIECTNHLLRNLCNKVKAAGSGGARKHSKVRQVVTNSVMKIRNAVVKAAAHRRTSNVSWEDKIDDLIRDLDNVLSHVFGEHKDCASLQYFCDGIRKENEANLVPELMEANIYEQLEYAMLRIKQNAESLLHNCTSNLVESTNNIISKMIGGKRTHLAQRGSYQMRVIAAVVQCNTFAPMKSVCHALRKEPPACATLLENRDVRNQTHRHNRYRVARESGVAIRKSKFSGKPDKDYGPNAERPDIGVDLYERLKSAHNENLEKNRKNWKAIEIETRSQDKCKNWHKYRKSLLTASNFGDVCLRLDTTPSEPLVRRIRYPQTFRSVAVEWGKQKENLARKELERFLGKKIKKCGLFIDQEFPYFGATPDGIFGNDFIVEIKCPYKARHLTPTQATEKKISELHRIFDINNDYAVKKTHKFYYQIQGQLHVTQRSNCIFAVWTPFGIQTAIVERDDTFWKDNMLKLLQRFYEQCMLPELIDPRRTRGMKLREPQYIIEAQEARRRKTLEKEAQQKKKYSGKKGTAEKESAAEKKSTAKRKRVAEKKSTVGRKLPRIRKETIIID